jgi:hypothetical protein
MILAIGLGLLGLFARARDPSCSTTSSAGVPPEAIEAIGDVRAAVDPTLVRRAIAPAAAPASASVSRCSRLTRRV